VVNVRLTRQAVEVLFKPGPITTVHRVSAEALVDPDDGTGNVRLTRQSADALMQIPAIATVHRVSAEALVDPDDGTGNVRLTRQATEVLYLPPPFAAVHRLSVEALVSPTTGTGRVRLTRQSAEVLYPRPVPPPVPETLVANFELFIHDWSQGLRLENAYMTDVTSSAATSAEERRILRDKPQRTQSIRYVNSTRAIIDRLIVNARRMTAARVQFPLYCDESIGTADTGPNFMGTQATVWCDTKYRRFFVGGRIAIVPANGEDRGNFVSSSAINTGIIAEINEDRILLEGNLTLSFQAGAFVVYPLIDCDYVLQPNVIFETHHVATWELAVIERLGANTLPATRENRPSDMPLLEGIPVLNFNYDQDFAGGVSVTYQRDGASFNRGRGTVVDPNDYRYKQVTEWNLIAMTRADAWKVIQFFDWARGRGRVFFQMDEEDLWTAVSAATTFIEIDPFGTYADFQADFGYIGIEMNDGTIHARRVNTIQNLGSVWRITTTGDNLPALDLTQIRRIARVRKSRMTDDSFEENWKSLEVARFKFTTIEVLDEGEETT
jgi:hypothetical protein